MALLQLLRRTVRPVRSAAPLRGLEEFFDAHALKQGVTVKPPTGREWTASELRRKSFEDLHKLWYVLLKERNMLLTMQHDARMHRARIEEPDRMKKVRTSMNHIKVVLGERESALKEHRQLVEAEVLKRKASATTAGRRRPSQR
eukprot:comp24795_c0_seq1/m.46883 comp24795_c0_seq1/g.46883  ORF comp24795_c0_seq1/g.46883 comp24795_c0_seq1/m.46883 type:complete len:144 (-) comp24795_c0_seq1:17-448(-)